MEKGHKDWILRFEATPEVAKIIEQYVFSMKNAWRIGLEELLE